MAYDDDDILTVRRTHPVVTALLLVGCIALITAITLSVKQLKTYVNPETRQRLGQDLSGSPVAWSESDRSDPQNLPARPVGGAEDGELTPEVDG